MLVDAIYLNKHVVVAALIQTQTDSWAHWFWTNAPAAWTSALIAIVTCVYVLSSRKKPRKIVVRELSKSSLVNIWPTVRSEIKMTFQEQPITSLAQINAEAFNEGSEEIADPVFTLAVPGASRILGTLIIPEDSKVPFEIQGNSVTIRPPYLNPVRAHGQVLQLSVLVDGDPQEIKVTGEGKGWSVRHSPLPSKRQENLWTAASATWMLLSAGGLFLYGRYIERKTGISLSEVSWRAFFADLPAFIGFAVTLLGLVIARRWRRFPRLLPRR